tara:strand:+ start:464 stop:1249 length:786 start_codon:yes stop_codon:yes gene_type:complete
MKKILFLCFSLISSLIALDLEKIILVNEYAEELDLIENTLWFEFMKNGNYCVMYNSKQDLAGFQFNFKDLKQTYADKKITFRNGQTQIEDFTLKYSEKTGIVLGFSMEGNTLPAGIDTLFEIVSENKIDDIKGYDMNVEAEKTNETVEVKPSLKGCDIPLNTFALSGNTIIYNSEHDIGGFQFDIQDALIDKVFGGDAEKSGFTTSSGKNLILSFSFEGKVIPAGCGTLLNLETDQKPSGIGNIIVSSIKGESLFFKYYKN